MTANAEKIRSSRRRQRRLRHRFRRGRPLQQNRGIHRPATPPLLPSAPATPLPPLPPDPPALGVAEAPAVIASGPPAVAAGRAASQELVAIADGQHPAVAAAGAKAVWTAGKT